MKYFSIDTLIDKELFGRFIDFYNNYAEEECTIVINSRGGDAYVMLSLTHMINTMPNVTIIIEAVYSAAFYIAYYCEAEKILSPVAKGMWHFGTAEITLNHNNKPTYWTDKCHIQNFPIEKKMFDELAKKIMNKKEFTAYKSDRDIYFPFSRMKEIFPKATIL